MTDTEPGVWIVADTHWGTEGPGLALPFPDELSGLRAANHAGWQQRAWFVPYGTDLRDVMNGTWKTPSPGNVEPDSLPDNTFDILLGHIPLWDANRCACGIHLYAPSGDRGAVWVTHVLRQINAETEKENRNA